METEEDQITKTLLHSREIPQNICLPLLIASSTVKVENDYVLIALVDVGFMLSEPTAAIWMPQLLAFGRIPPREGSVGNGHNYWTDVVHRKKTTCCPLF